jgi:hypothetical protein
VKRIELLVPTSRFDVREMLVAARVRMGSLTRRVLDLRASDAARARVHLMAIYLGQNGLSIADPALEKPIVELTEREALRIVRVTGQRLRSFAAARAYVAGVAEKLMMSAPPSLLQVLSDALASEDWGAMVRLAPELVQIEAVDRLAIVDRCRERMPRDWWMKFARVAGEPSHA